MIFTITLQDRTRTYSLPEVEEHGKIPFQTYNTDFVTRSTHSNTDSNTQTKVNSGPITTETIPYIRGTSETIRARILQRLQYTCCTQTDNHLTTTILTNVKDKDKPEDRQGAVYKIKCCDCQATYIETGRNLSTRLTEHTWGTRNGDVTIR